MTKTKADVKGNYWLFLDYDFDVMRVKAPAQLLINYLEALVEEDESNVEDLGKQLAKYITESGVDRVEDCIPQYDASRAIRAIRRGQTSYLGECECIAVIGKTKAAAAKRYGREAGSGW